MHVLRVDVLVLVPFAVVVSHSVVAFLSVCDVNMIF